jgi:pilus assembly protein Flp/PilA
MQRQRKPRIVIMKTLLYRFAGDNTGVTAIEYGLIASLIAVVIITSVTLVGTNLTAKFNAIAGAL